ncbi:MAG TPA: hypothetical protein PLW97_05230, partial [Synergistaceae bacterium]|nr:hypothetical protein [Synergistaceae bacterium]
NISSSSGLLQQSRGAFFDDPSEAVREGRFVGLPLDDNNQAELTESRLQSWAEQLRKELSL